MQPAYDVRSSVAPALARPVLVARNGDQAPVRPVAPVSAFKRVVEQDDSQPRAEERRSDEVLRDKNSSRDVATVITPITTRITSSLFLAQHIAQEIDVESRSSRAEDEASVAAYRAAAERGTIYFGLEFPVDFSV